MSLFSSKLVVDESATQASDEHSNHVVCSKERDQRVLTANQIKLCRQSFLKYRTVVNPLGTSDHFNLLLENRFQEKPFIL